MRVALLGVLCGFVFAQGEDLGERVQRLEKALAEERARSDRHEKRIRELEQSLEQATEELAHSQDRRLLEEEIESYLKDGRVGETAGAAAPSRLNIGGVLVGSYRATFFEGATEDTNTFLMEDRYLRFVYRFDEQVTARYYTDGSLAELEYHPLDLLQLNVGVVVVPFGQFNARAFPDTFDTLSRPLLYLGDEDAFASDENLPERVFRSVYSDTGVVVSGSRWDGDRQLYYAVYVVNGLTGGDELGEDSTFSDNNHNKQIGARFTWATGFEGGRAAAGVSWMNGKFDGADILSHRMYGGDLLLALDGVFGEESALTFRGEYVFAPSEILYPDAGNPAVLINDAQREQGAYLIVEARLDRNWMVYVEGDWMQRKGPRVTGGTLDPAAQDDITTRILRASAGVVYKFAIGIVWKLEYAWWDFDEGVPDTHRISTQVVIPF